MSRHFQTVHYVDFKTSENMASIDESPKQVEKPKPASAKGKYLRKITISSTMGPGIKIDVNRLRVVE
jgi:large subunit ribosomal protein L1